MYMFKMEYGHLHIFATRINKAHFLSPKSFIFLQIAFKVYPLCASFYLHAIFYFNLHSGDFRSAERVNFINKKPLVRNDFVRSGIVLLKNSHVNSVTFDIFVFSSRFSLIARVVSFVCNGSAPREPRLLCRTTL